jgi:hypothetical protein
MNSMVLAFVTIAYSVENKDPNIFNLGPTLLTISTLIEVGVNLLYIVNKKNINFSFTLTQYAWLYQGPHNFE